METTTFNENNEFESITFKISVANKAILKKVATELGVSLSEYVRIKVMMDESERLKLVQQVRDLKITENEYEIYKRTHDAGVIDPDCIILKTNPEGKSLLMSALNQLQWDNSPLGANRIENDYQLGTHLSQMIIKPFEMAFDKVTRFSRRNRISNSSDLYSKIFGYYQKE